MSARKLGLLVGVPAGLVLSVATLSGQPTGVIGVIVAWVIVLLPIALTVRVARRARLGVLRSLAWGALGAVVGFFVPVIPIAVDLFT